MFIIILTTFEKFLVFGRTIGQGNLNLRGNKIKYNNSSNNSCLLLAVQLLVQAGARADLYNDDLGLAPVHVACQQNRLDMLKVS